MCDTTGTGDAKNRALSAVTAAPAVSWPTRTAPATTGTALSRTNAADNRHRRRGGLETVVMPGIMPTDRSRRIRIWAGAALADGPAAGSYFRRSAAEAVGLVRPDGDLHPVAGVQLRHQARYVRLDGTEGDVELVGDLVVGPSTRDSPEHLLLAFGERVDGLHGPHCRTVGGERVEQPGGDAGGDQGVAVRGRVHGLREHGGAGVLQQEA